MAKPVMRIDSETAQQFLDAINDYVSNGDIVILAISPEDAGGVNRPAMNEMLFDLFEEVLKLRKEPKQCL